MFRVVKIIGLDIVGIDVVIEDIFKLLWLVEGVIVEVNVVLGFWMYVVFSCGLVRNVVGVVMDMLFLGLKNGWILILIVIGINGKMIIMWLLVYIMK